MILFKDWGGRKWDLWLLLNYLLGVRRKQDKILVDQVFLVFSQYSPSEQKLNLSPEEEWHIFKQLFAKSVDGKVNSGFKCVSTEEIEDCGFHRAEWSITNHDRKKEGTGAIDESKFQAKQTAYTWCPLKSGKLLPRCQTAVIKTYINRDVASNGSMYTFSKKALDHRPKEKKIP